MDFNFGDSSDSEVIKGVQQFRFGIAALDSGALGIVNLPGSGAADDFADETEVVFREEIECSAVF